MLSYTSFNHINQQAIQKMFKEFRYLLGCERSFVMALSSMLLFRLPPPPPIIIIKTIAAMANSGKRSSFPHPHPQPQPPPENEPLK